MSKKKGDTEVAVLEYMTAQNRPFNVTDIVNNLHNEHGKAAVQKALDSLVEEEKITEKTYGKQKVYVVNQNGLKEASQEELQVMQNKIEELENHIKEADTGVKEVQTQLKTLLTSLTTEEAREQVLQLRKEVEELRTRHKALSENTVKIDAKERTEIRKKRERVVSEWRTRKRRCMDMLATILEASPQKKEDVFEEIGVETDEDVQAVLPTL